jgi:hypothetical protein
MMQTRACLNHSDDLGFYQLAPAAAPQEVGQECCALYFSFIITPYCASFNQYLSK